ncbi:MAG: hypothetical protein HY780_05595 [Chloroflexi bacterium]|nr:hypothetical protein [Chloroflexota bacterium]
MVNRSVARIFPSVLGGLYRRVCARERKLRRFFLMIATEKETLFKTSLPYISSLVKNPKGLFGNSQIHEGKADL